MIKALESTVMKQILKDNYIGHLAYILKNRPYVVPITYYYNEDDNSVISYSTEGQKINAMRKANSVSLEVSVIESVNKWKSVMAHGEFEELKGPDAKYLLHKFSDGVKQLISNKEKKELQFISEFSSKAYFNHIPIVYRIKIYEMTGKERNHSV